MNELPLHTATPPGRLLSPGENVKFSPEVNDDPSSEHCICRSPVEVIPGPQYEAVFVESTMEEKARESPPTRPMFPDEVNT